MQKYKDYKFDPVNLVIGILIGLIIAVIVVWITYETRTFAFTHCPRSTRHCGTDDYYQTSKEALDAHPELTADDLFDYRNGGMFYKRIRKNTSCVPQGIQLKRIEYPPICKFTSTNGGGPIIAPDSSFGANSYYIGNGEYISTTGDCNPKNERLWTGEIVQLVVKDGKWSSS